MDVSNIFCGDHTEWVFMEKTPSNAVKRETTKICDNMQS